LLSYKHLYHAGNFADVHKHAVLSLLLQALQQKPAAFCYAETHAGSARYDLQAAAAQLNREYSQGIAVILAATEVIAEIQPYKHIVQRHNGTQAGLRYYPGSPAIAQDFLRAQDAMLLAELHPNEAPQLRAYFKADKRVAVHQRDGFEMLKALLPPKQTRGLVLIDPAYEDKQDYRRVLEALRLVRQRWAGGMAIVWYPILDAEATQRFRQSVQQTSLRDVLCCEIQVRPLQGPPGMKGSGLLIMNPPWGLDQQLQRLMPWLAQQLQIEHAAEPWRVQSLIPE